MKRLVCAALLIWVLGLGPWAAAAAGGEGTLLDPSSVPAGWVLVGEYLASPAELAEFSARLGVTLQELVNYTFATPQGTIQVNLVLTGTDGEAESLQQLFLSIHPPELVGRSGRRVMEIITELPELADLAREALVFQRAENLSPVEPSVLREYLEGWSWTVATWEDLTWHLGRELDSYRVFLVGESHGAAFNQGLQTALVEFMVKEGQVRHLLLELSPSLVGFLREYVRTGDEALLQLAFAQVQGTYFFTQENYAHWQSIRALQEELPPGEELRLIGLDVEHQPLMALRYLQHLLSKVPEESWSSTKLAQINQVLTGELRLDYAEAVLFTEHLLLELETAQLQEALGELWGEFELVLSSLLAGLQLQSVSGPAWNNGRDAAMYHNLLKQISLDGGEKYFGQWGVNHVFQGQQMGVDWLAARLAGTEGFAGSVFSLVLIYSAGEHLSQDGLQVLPLDTYRSTAVPLLADLAGKEPLLVKLDGLESPFSRNQLWPLKEAVPLSGVTTDYFQYILLVPGAGASTPLGL